MLMTRVIPTLLIKKRGLYKGRCFSDHKYVGDPINAVKIFNEKEVDEIVLLDIGATNDNAEPEYEYLKSITSQAFMPLGYGGGISNIKHIEQLFKCGVEKAIINTAACINPSFISEASTVAGSQSIVVSIDVRKNKKGRYSVFSNSGKKDTGLDPVEFAIRIEEAGAGEVILCSIDNDGTMLGYDTQIINDVSSHLTIPLVASGGAGKIEHFKDAITAGASAVSAGSLFVFQGKYRAVLISYPKQEEIISALA
jgi:imidazole glycerol-phosphate synthase subunit HisF